jgi:hypothetical protein
MDLTPDTGGIPNSTTKHSFTGIWRNNVWNSYQSAAFIKRYDFYSSPRGV